MQLTELIHELRALSPAERRQILTTFVQEIEETQDNNLYDARIGEPDGSELREVLAQLRLAPPA